MDDRFASSAQQMGEEMRKYTTEWFCNRCGNPLPKGNQGREFTRMPLALQYLKDSFVATIYVEHNQAFLENQSPHDFCPMCKLKMLLEILKGEWEVDTGRERAHYLQPETYKCRLIGHLDQAIPYTLRVVDEIKSEEK